MSHADPHHDGHHHGKRIAPEDVLVPSGHGLRKLPVVFGAVGVVALGLAFALKGDAGSAFWGGYLTSFMFWLSLALGGLFFVVLQHATRAGWSPVVRRIAENFMITLPLFALLFVPIVLGGVHDLYHWSHPEAVAGDAILQKKSVYLNEGDYLVRAIVYLVVWTAFAFLMYRSSTRQDDTGDPNLTRRMQWWGPLGILFFALTTTFAAVDWMMSTDPHWFSTIFGVYYFAGCCIAIFASLALTSMALQKKGFLQGIVTVHHYHDLGKLLFAFVVFWSYIAFSQYFLIWYANIPEETLWYAHRAEHGWQVLGIFLMVGHFALPFLFLMSRHIKRRKATLAVGAIWMLIAHYFDLYYIVMPAVSHGHGLHLSLYDLLAFVGIGGLMLAVFTWRLGAKALVPIRDPRLGESLAFENF